MRRHDPVIIGTLALGVLLRLLGLRGDLWLDEVWNIALVNRVSSFVAIFTEIRVDNNHLLNSLWLYLLKVVTGHTLDRDMAVLWYRGFAAVSGLATLGLLPRLADSLGSALVPPGVTTTFRRLLIFLFSCSYMMVLYSTEARGYAPLMFFSVLALVAALPFEKSPPRRAVLGIFWLATLGGMLSHALFFQLYAGIVVAQAWVWFRDYSRGRLITMFFVWHAVPLFGAVALWFLFYRWLPPGGGDQFSLLEVLCNTLNAAISLPPLGAVSLDVGAALFGVAVLLLVGVLAALQRLWQRGSSLFLFLFSIILLFPLLTLLLLSPRVLFERYFLVAIMGAYFLLASELARMWHGSLQERVGAFVLSAIVLIATGHGLFLLARVGRGSYRAVAEEIARAPAGERATLSTNQIFRAREMLLFYWPGQFPHTVKITSTEEPGCTDWILLQSVSNSTVQERVSLPGCSERRYFLRLRALHANLSGASWMLYGAAPLPIHAGQE